MVKIAVIETLKKRYFLNNWDLIYLCCKLDAQWKFVCQLLNNFCVPSQHCQLHGTRSFLQLHQQMFIHRLSICMCQQQ